MKKLSKIKLADLTSETSKVKVEEMKKITGGVDLRDGCVRGVCSQKVNTLYCEGGAVCTSGIAG